jgi:hypothetical protein
MTTKEKTTIVFVLDKSGSMNCIRDSTIKSTNDFIEQQKKVVTELRVNPANIRFTLITFNHRVKTVFSNRQITEVPPLTRDTFSPDGRTALYDAIGHAITTVNVENTDVECVILTDGLENASEEWNARKVGDLIDRKKDEGWKFTYLGANQDSFSEGSKISLCAADCSNFAYSGEGVRGAISKASTNVYQSMCSKYSRV